VDCEIIASGTRPKERRKAPGLIGKFYGRDGYSLNGHSRNEGQKSRAERHDFIV